MPRPMSRFETTLLLQHHHEESAYLLHDAEAPSVSSPRAFSSPEEATTMDTPIGRHMHRTSRFGVRSAMTIEQVILLLS